MQSNAHPARQKKGTGHHHHGEGSYNHRFVARKDQDRPNRNWNNQGNVTYPQPTEGLPRGIIKHLPMPHTSGMYVAPTLGPFGPPISYPGMSHFLWPIIYIVFYYWIDVLHILFRVSILLRSHST